jgi:hypothetical protein
MTCKKRTINHLLPSLPRGGVQLTNSALTPSISLSYLSTSLRKASFVSRSRDRSALWMYVIDALFSALKIWYRWTVEDSENHDMRLMIIEREMENRQNVSQRSGPQLANNNGKSAIRKTRDLHSRQNPTTKKSFPTK